VLEENISNRIVETAKICYTKMDGKDYPRLDLRICEGIMNVLEINNNPGIDFEDDSGIGLSTKAAGFTSFAELLTHIVENAYRRFL
jgi:D-alanine-D-alanine ligase-like ATP-grasp enzyme